MSQGSLAANFDNVTGVFTAPVTGVYLLTLNITYQNNPITINDGTRQMRFRRRWLSTEPAFIGQSTWVTLPVSPTGPFYDAFDVMLSCSAAVPIPAGGQLDVLTYQDNSQGASIRAFTELDISQLLVDPSLNPLLLGAPPIGPTA